MFQQTIYNQAVFCSFEKRDYAAESFEIKGAHTCINVGERFGGFFLFFGRTFLH